MASSMQSWRTSAARFAFLFAAALALAGGVLLTLQDKNMTSAAIMSSIGLNLVASVVFALIFSFFSSEKQEAALKENLNEQFGVLSDALLDRMSDANRIFLPSGRYPATDTFDDDFNRHLNQSLATTTSYVFRGPSARFVAARLSHVHHNPGSVRVSMLAPDNPSALYQRAADRRLWPSSVGKTSSRLSEEILTEILMSIVSLFDYRHVCPIDIIYSADPSVYRMEMTDDSVYISWYHANSSLEKQMPESLRFPKGSFLYSILDLETKRLFELSENRVRFDSTKDEAFLITHMQTISGRAITEEDVAAWRAEYRNYTLGFSDYLRNL
ncbi:hypothetical protein GCM10010218_40350 [Streptomyces mashuensis]|uniref:Uncharacterized protein n=1 Tax=Streptomyces mashuensis TaxID=33904 RepID=A0A919B4T1_9ACTN|nr:hypothetical protein [Streptomyces mashuensis]GHF54940.1 hypothetical protein GCM10010218_40350 [Streptomyces mashuensis]